MRISAHQTLAQMNPTSTLSRETLVTQLIPLRWISTVVGAGAASSSWLEAPPAARPCRTSQLPSPPLTQPSQSRAAPSPRVWIEGNRCSGQLMSGTEPRSHRISGNNCTVHSQLYRPQIYLCGSEQSLRVDHWI